MSSEVSFDATSVELGLGWSDAVVSEEASSSSSTIHTEIFSPPPYPLFQSDHQFKGALTNPGATDQRMSQVSASRSIIPSLQAGGYNGFVRYEFIWDENGNKRERVTGGLEDNQGNYVEGTGTQNSDGSGGVSFEGGHKN